MDRVGLWQVVRQRARQAGVPRFSPHDLRRSFITNLLDSGVDLLTTRTLAGHALVESTAAYDRRGEANAIRVSNTVHVPVSPPKRRKGITIAFPEHKHFPLTKAAWKILDALRANGAMAVVERWDRKPVVAEDGTIQFKYPPGFIKARPTKEIAENPRLAKIQHNRYTTVHATMLRLEKMGLVRCIGHGYQPGKQRPRLSPFEIKPLGTAMAVVSANRRNRGQTLRWRYLRKRAWEWLEDHAPEGA